LSEAGSEKLLGNGDMLYKDSSMGNYERYQGAYISGREITNVVNYIKENNASYFDEEVFEFLENETNPKQEEPTNEMGGVSTNSNLSENDALFKKALWFAITGGSVSISSLQRRFRLGYARAGSLVDSMEQLNFISANEGSKARRVIITREEFLDKFGPVEDEGY
jgi:S-DNA-T family DNA segregation ATPase FtsK/SpoIIIE